MNLATADFILTLVTVHLIAGSALAALVWLAMKLPLSSNAATRHNVWLLTLIALVVMPALTLVSKDFSRAARGFMTEGQVQNSSSLQTPAGTAVSAAGATSRPAPQVRPRDQEHDILGPDQRSALAWTVLSVWLLGVVLGLIRLTSSFLQLRKLKHSARSAPAQLTHWFDAARIEMGIRRPVVLKSAPAAASPMTVGLVRPWVEFPTCLPAAMSDEAIHGALRHELAHIQRGDPWTNFFQHLATTLFFFHPAVRLVADRMELEREVACDDWAVNHGHTVREYANTLVEICRELKTDKRQVFATGCVRTRSQLRTRIAHLLDDHSDHTTRTRALSAVATAALLVVGLAGTALAMPEVERTANRDDQQGQSRPAGDPDENVGSLEFKHGLLGAAYRGDLDGVRQELVDGVDPNLVFRQRRGSPRTALVAAAGQGHASVVATLLEAGADPRFHAEGDGTPLIAAARGGDRDIVRMLLDSGADADTAVPGDGSALIAAARRGDRVMTEVLIAAGATPNRYVERDEDPLFHAAAGGHLDVLRVLVARGGDIDRIYEGDGTLVMIATRNGHHRVASWLIDQGADLDLAVSGDGTALIEAVRVGDRDVVRQLIARGADVNHTVPRDGSPLIAAAARADSRMLQMLLEAGADVNLAVPRDDTPLINAIRTGDIRIVGMLLDAGADPNQPGDRDRQSGELRTPLNTAESEGHDSILRLLLTHGARTD